MDAAALCVRFHGEFCLSEAAYAITERRKDGSFQKAFARTEDMRHARLGLRWKRARMKDVNEHLKDDYVKRGVRSCFPGRRKESGGRTCTPPACRSRGAFERVQFSQTCNRTQRHVRWARGDSFVEKSRFPKQKWRHCRLRARKFEGLSRKLAGKTAAREIAPARPKDKMTA